MILYFYYIVAAFLLFACSSDNPDLTGAKGPSGARSDVSGTLQQPGAAVEKAYALEITPKEATRKTILNLSSTGFDLSRAQIEWLVNGRPLSTQVPAQFDGTDAAKGDTIQAKAVIQGREILSDSVQLLNVPPELTRVKIMPEVIQRGDTLYIEAVGSDADGDSVTLLYEWTLNGLPSGKGKGIEATLKRGDKVRVRVTPTDGEVNGQSVILTHEIVNWPPAVVEHKNFSFDGTVYTYQVKASDTDGDTLVYSLETPLNGMTIHPATGLLQWIVPPDFKGDKNVTVFVADGNGGIARYTLKITIQEQPPR